jgi:hypothetical protein
MDTNWLSDLGYAPVAFTNLVNQPNAGDGNALLLDSTNAAYLQYNVIENDGTTNLTVDVGSVAFWFAPAWAGTNNGGSGPGQWGRLLEVGGYTPDASFGWWSLYVDDVGANLYFTVQPGDGSTTPCLTAPINWTSNYWHFIALTYSATNTALYLDGLLATNGTGLTSWPGPNVLAGGFYIGSDSNGVIQAQGAFDDLYTYNAPLDSNTVYSGIYKLYWPDYYLSPWNMPNSIVSAPSSPSYAPTFDVITGPGDLQSLGSASGCWSGANSNQVWITNITATAAGSGTMNVTFTIAGGADYTPYDVFATSALAYPITNALWAWMGQGYSCHIYTLTNVPSSTCFLILGTPQDTLGYGLTDAYELLVAKVNPNGAQTDSYGVPYAWYAENGLVPITAGLATQDPDYDGLLNWQEYLWGTNPNVSEGFAIWVSSPGGVLGIP